MHNTQWVLPNTHAPILESSHFPVKACHCTMGKLRHLRVEVTVAKSVFVSGNLFLRQNFPNIEEEFA